MHRTIWWLLFLTGCAGFYRNCSSCSAQNFGSDWVVVQVDLEGHPFRCWSLKEVSIANEPSSDGIYWVDNQSGNLVHISGLYNRVQVVGGRWAAAYAEVGIDEATCQAIHALRYSPSDGEYLGPSSP